MHFFHSSVISSFYKDNLRRCIINCHLLILYWANHLYRDAAIVMLSGQIADAFATVFAGELVWIIDFYFDSI